jgi:hypothetical protein
MRSVFQMVGILSLALLAACAGPYVLESSPDLLAAQGALRVKSTGNGNSKLKLEVKHLAQPEKVSASARTFVVWAVPQNSPGVAAQNLGAFQVDSDLEGSIETTTPHHNFEFFVTAEPKGDVGVPTGRKLMWTTIK